ncbi:hypothetical protein [Carboxydothermus hydrogenoformans]|uniref:Uncharacterized protein n=1 Tax=Carboxydothermus hydrogenoformans (strain ATCC BAA-161 / DSM 6008 / Z-2901) TaxID=246194 RepID=Q3ACJ2_CARHZ|nr:hypothetical protein [Carboxydothermus hydrogenoformans]ABB15582.1 hypothetical protein CHY_1308 [Carboxydothermus hydrogenoformans Z-2901]
MSKKIKVRFLPKGRGPKHGAPVTIAYVDVKEFQEANLEIDEGLKIIAKYFNSPVAINVFDMENAFTTTSDGLCVEGAIIAFAAADRGKIHPEFGRLFCKERELKPEMFEREPHLRMGYENFPTKKLYIGPDPAQKLVPLHNVVISGRTVNNNSGTEVMDCVTMEEMLLPILGQLQIMRDEDILWGITGGHISVGIGCTIVEDYSRSQPFMKCKPGNTAHNSGPYAQTLKAKLPCIVAPKDVLAKHILDALDFGLRPAKELGCSPAVLYVAAYYGVDLNIENITPAARLELEALGIDLDKLPEITPKLSREEIIARADEIIPGVENAELIPSTAIIEKVEIVL